jgi:hypothetical protein
MGILVIYGKPRLPVDETAEATCKRVNKPVEAESLTEP